MLLLCEKQPFSKKMAVREKRNKYVAVVGSLFGTLGTVKLNGPTKENGYVSTWHMASTSTICAELWSCFGIVVRIFFIIIVIITEVLLVFCFLFVTPFQSLFLTCVNTLTHLSKRGPFHFRFYVRAQYGTFLPSPFVARSFSLTFLHRFFFFYSKCKYHKSHGSKK